MSVSAVDCIQPAIRHVREQLFARFTWGQWSRLALVGVLAAEIHGGGCGRGFSRLAQSQKHGQAVPPIFHPPHIDPARIAQFLGLFLFAILLIVVLGFILLYVSSVFRFILFDSVLRRNCSIGEGWSRWQKAGGRFFLWQLVFQISAGLFFAILVGVPILLAGASGWITHPMENLGRLGVGLILLIGAIVFFALIAACVQLLARDFLVPIMALEGLDFADGWSRLLAIIRPEPWKYVGYIILKVILIIVAAIIFGILSIIPIVAVALPVVPIAIAAKAGGLVWNVTNISLVVIFGTMLLLLLIYLIALVSVPAIVFFPAFAIYFFASRYPNLGMLLNPAPVAPPPQAPALPITPPMSPPSPEPIG